MKTKGIVNSVADIREWNQELQIGFTLTDNPKKWYNAKDDLVNLEIIKKLVLIKGTEIEFESTLKGVTDLVVVTEAKDVPQDKPNSKWDEEIVSFETLLSKAHQIGHFSIKTQMLDIDVPKKYALFKASVHSKLGTFEAHGDSTDENITGTFIKPHFIRMAETRAICRALRWMTNNGVAEEEKTESETTQQDTQ